MTNIEDLNSPIISGELVLSIPRKNSQAVTDQGGLSTDGSTSPLIIGETDSSILGQFLHTEKLAYFVTVCRSADRETITY